MCKVLALTNDTITVSYDGWSSKYDETHKLGNRVMHFRSHTELYTGA